MENKPNINELEIYAEAQEKKQQLSHNEEIHALRKDYLSKIYKLIVNYLKIIAVFMIIQMVMTAFKKALSDAVLITILTTTTMNVLG